VVAEITTRFLGSETAPLVVEPVSSLAPITARGGLAAWLRDNQPWVDAQIAEHGALLFRGFGLRTAEEFEEAARHMVRSFGDYAGGVSPRSRVTAAVSTSTEAPPFLPITLHQ